jgi:hypothetical protein
VQEDRVVFRVIQVFGDVCHARPPAAEVNEKAGRQARLKG